MLLKTALAKARNIYYLCAPYGFEGFWPGYPDFFPNNYDCPFAVMAPSNINGSVELVSSDPRDMPKINTGFFTQGVDNDPDLNSMQEATQFFRNIFNNVTGNKFTEMNPCTHEGCTVKEQKEWLRDQVWSHHGTSTCAIGADGDPMAVLDSKFRVRGVKNLRVVDGSAFPKVPGAYPVLPTFMISEKATEDILNNY